MQLIIQAIFLGLILASTFSTSFASFYLRGLGSKKCQNILASATTNGASNVIWDCFENADNELFDNVPVDPKYNVNGETYFLIKAKHSGKCLDIYGGESATKNGVKVDQWDCYPTNTAQMFTYVPSKKYPGYYMIKARSSGKCLNVLGEGTENQSQIVQWECFDAPNDNWEITSCINSKTNAFGI